MKTILLIFFAIFNLINAQQYPPVYVVLFTHIEDNTPAGTLGTPQSRQAYIQLRNKLISVASLFRSYNMQWSFQPDWKILLAALMYEDSSLIISTNGKNFLRYMKEDLGVFIDPHSHENYGYNYTDVAHLLDSLGTGGSTVIGGHIWDPNIPSFQNWDRFRVPVKGIKYPWAVWRGDILMGSGTPNHVNDPLVSGVWRPKDKYNYFTDDSLGNISSVGQYKSDISSILELVNLYKTGIVSPAYILTSSYHVKPVTITSTNGLKEIEDSVITPLAILRNNGEIKITNFTTLINDWKTLFGSRAYIYDPNKPSDVRGKNALPDNFRLYQNYPNPFNPTTIINYELPTSPSFPLLEGEGVRERLVRLKVYDLLGNEVATLVNKELPAGSYTAKFNASALSSGTYFYELRVGNYREVRKMVLMK